MGYLKFGTLFAIAIVFGLPMGTAPQPAMAQAAKKLKCKGCVKSKQIRDGGINSIDIGNGQVGNDDLGLDAVTGDKVRNNSLTGSDIQNGSVGSSDITNNSLTDFDLAPDSVGTSEIQTNAVGSSEVQDNSIPSTDLSNEAGVAYAASNQTLVLPAGINTVVRSVVLTAPSNGRVIVNASGSFDFLSVTGDGVVCSITIGTTTETTDTILGQDAGNSVRSMPFAGVRVFDVGPGSNTFNLVCIEFAGDVTIFDSKMAAIFVPTPY